MNAKPTGEYGFSCVKCPLFSIGRGFLSSEGTGANGCLIVGEAAGSHEAAASLPFRPSAPTGGLLQRLFDMSGLQREDFTIFNVVNCQPPGNELVGAEYEADATANCRQYLDAVVERVKPRMILALGKTAMAALTGRPSANILELRGFVLDSIYDVPLIGSYHPSFLNRGAMHLLGVSQLDLRRAESYARNGVPRPMEVKYELEPTADCVRDYLDYLRTHSTLPIAYDIETEGILGVKEPEALSEKGVIQIQFSSTAGTALVLPWPHEGALEILKLPNMKWDWWGRLFDRKVLRSQGVTINGECHDLFDAAGHLQPNFLSSKDDSHGDKGIPSKLMSLQSWVSFYFPYEPVWKSEMRAGMNGGVADMNAIRWGGGRDVDMTYRLGVKLFDSLKRNGLW